MNASKEIMSLVGKTFDYREELSRAGLKWNAATKSWDGELNETFAAEQVRRAIESGILKKRGQNRVSAGMEMRNGPGRNEIDNQYL